MIELIFKIKFSGYLILFYMIFVFFASFLGCVLNFYKLYDGYDKIMHFIFGYVGCVAGLFLFCKLGNLQSRPAFIILFCFTVSMACGAVWEIFEFIGDNFFNQTAQGLPVTTINGETVISVSDSMLDLITNLGGALVFSLHYLLHAVLKKGLLVDKFKSEFSRSLKKEKNLKEI